MTGKDRVPATLAQALGARGFTTLTPVQNAILDAASPEADMLVSARTGSGKTVALGLAFGRRLLGPGGRFAAAAGPRALVLTPTRELAAQVRGELAWLFAATGARVGSCTGGADARAERAALDRGLDIVVGSPGRLRDHISQGALITADLGVVVLDEADDMLDMGFRDDLEAILRAVPPTRQTLMFSATVTPRIEALARRFQRGVLRIDAGAPADAGEIAFQGMLVAAPERDKAIVNLLCVHETGSALVFCGRREVVGQLAALLAARGFQVVALSGELAQKERDAALAAMRDGRAKVCVATDVAARGIDLPGLDLVIHADLPANRETLLHRSGRTGRAGRGGVAILIVPPGQRRRAEALVAQAGLALDWRPAPRREDVEASHQARLLGDPALAVPPTEKERTTIATLLTAHAAERIAAAFLRLWTASRPAAEDLGEGDADAAPAAPRRAVGGVWFSLALGQGGAADIRWILPLICKLGRVSRRDIGRIRVLEGETQFEVRRAAARGFAAAAARHGEAGLSLRRLAGPPARIAGAPAPQPD